MVGVFSPSSVILLQLLNFFILVLGSESLALHDLLICLGHSLPSPVGQGNDFFDDTSYVKFMKGLAASMPVSRPIPVQWILEVVLSFLRGLDPWILFLR